jgi:hypothetical protein
MRGMRVEGEEEGIHEFMIWWCWSWCVGLELQWSVAFVEALTTASER